MVLSHVGIIIQMTKETIFQKIISNGKFKNKIKEW